MKLTPALACLVVLVGTASAQEEVELTSLRKIADNAPWGALSQDGKWALVAKRNPKAPPAFTFALVDTASGKEKFSVDSDLNNNRPMAGFVRPEAISPDGTRILVPSRGGDRPPDRWGGARLLIGEAGRKPVTLATSRPSAWYGAWSADGKSVYFLESGRLEDLGYAVRRFTSATDTYETLHENKGRLAFNLRTSPDGKRLAFYDFPGKDEEMRLIVLSIEDRQVVESEPFPMDNTMESGVGSITWESWGLIYHRSPPGPRAAGAARGVEPWLFDPESRKSRTLFEGVPAAFILGQADKDHQFASSAQSFFLVNREGRRVHLPSGWHGLSAGGDAWLVRDREEGNLFVTRPKRTAK